MTKLKEELKFGDYDLFNPMDLKPPYSDREIKSINYINLLTVSSAYLSLSCNEGSKYERQIAKIIKRIVWLRDRGTTRNWEKVPSFRLDQFDYIGICREFFPERTLPTFLFDFLAFFCVERADASVIYIEIQRILIKDLVERGDIYDIEMKKKPKTKGAKLEVVTEEEEIEIFTDNVDDKPCVYFIFCKVNNKMKIGTTISNPRSRLQTLQTGSPTILKLVGCMYCDKATELEKTLHSKFNYLNSHNEWFEATEEIWSYINKNATLIEE